MKIRSLAIAAVAVAALGVGGVAVAGAASADTPKSSSSSHYGAVYTGDRVQYVNSDGTEDTSTAYQTRIRVFKGRVVSVRTTYYFAGEAQTGESMWSRSAKMLDGQAAAIVNRKGSLDELVLDPNESGTAEGAPRMVRFYQTSLRSALAKAGK